MYLQKRIFLFLLFIPIFLIGGKIELQKGHVPERSHPATHALEQYFGRTAERVPLAEANRAVDNRLLVMLIDFVEDSDSTTTGNGKFQFSDDEYLIDLGKPPHDQEYYSYVMESVRYYYQAASLGAYDLEFDVYPHYDYTSSDSAIVAYTLKHEMSYYNPIGVDTATMISRFEEYFRDVFERVDEDDEVDFSQYGHYMIIHAGSDYQHDIMGDTRSDIPSFFITVGDGKEVIVDDGIVIDHACNVPETISQDGQYGVTTAVTAHEFGHSLGFIDLYSTLTGSPQVGWFDIMDSGGMGELIVAEIDGELITIEGGLPALPSAWHRILAWEDYFRANGILKDIDELDWSEPIRVEPAEKLLSWIGTDDPYFIKIPLTDTEYLLVENRQVDPDGDSGVSFKGALAQYPNDPFDKGYRILLYPTYPAPDPREDPTWEYDLFLPGWQNQSEVDGRYYNYGGGLVVWHIDDNIIYETGVWEDGEFYSNYDQNTVNALHSQRGIKVVEADGFDDIGNYSDGYNIMGSAYDPFYLYNPLLSKDGYFLGWDDSGMIPGYQPVNEDEFIHTIEYNGSSFPRLQTNDGDPFMFGMYGISSYSVEVNAERSMSFRWGSHLFDELTVLGEYGKIQGISGVTEVSTFPSLAVITGDSIELMTLIGDEWGNHFSLDIPFGLVPDLPLVSVDTDGDQVEEILIASDSMLTIMNGIEVTQEIYPAEFSDMPMYIDETAVYPLADRLLIGAEELPVAGAKLSYDQEYVIAANQEGVWYIDPDTKEIARQYELSSDVAYYPAVFHFQNGAKYCYQATSNGDIWKIAAGEIHRIFKSSDYSDIAPSQLLLTPLYEAGRTWLVFAAGEYLFAVTDEGTLAEGFPIYMENREIEPGSWLQGLKLNGEYLILLKRDTEAVFALNGAGNYRSDLSAISTTAVNTSQYWYDATSAELNWFGTDSEGGLLLGKLMEITENPLINQGYRNEGYNSFTGTIIDLPQAQEGLRAYAFPNPAKHDYAVVRVFEAEGSIDLKLYDIAGNLVMERSEDKEENVYQDIRLEINGISSGIYYARIKSSNKSLTVPLGIEK
ncbi:MAG: T9SS type A sorting domain-containing protein [Candidatus Cloacimonetes bacterium]|nr:T9SS type A sorting domain-containing protein [Candidatus Cloacimonadota bacterium]